MVQLVFKQKLKTCTKFWISIYNPKKLQWIDKWRKEWMNAWEGEWTNCGVNQRMIGGMNKWPEG